MAEKEKATLERVTESFGTIPKEKKEQALIYMEGLAAGVKLAGGGYQQESAKEEK